MFLPVNAVLIRYRDTISTNSNYSVVGETGHSGHVKGVGESMFFLPLFMFFFLSNLKRYKVVLSRVTKSNLRTHFNTRIS